jgi:hypothetical protein
VETAVQVAARLTNSRFPTQPIAPTILANKEINIRGTAFSPLLDILRNCFQNAIEHAEVDGRAPSTIIRCVPNGDAFHFEVANELPSHRNRQQTVRLAEAARRGERSVATPDSGRGTGLREIERVLAQEGPAGSELVISITEDGQFAVSFDVRG